MLRESILELRNEGKSYNEIKDILGCSKSTISYHCGEGQKEKTKNRIRKRRNNKIIKNTENFKYRKNIGRNIWRFQKTEIEDGKRLCNSSLECNFNWKDIIDIYSEDTFCYISGKEINLYESDYSFDHIIPISRGGDNTIENLGITHRVVNQMKSDLSVEELLIWCKDILENNGYVVNKI